MKDELRHGGQRSRRSRRSADALARGLGWFSLGLGLAELIAPRLLGRALGMERQSGLLQAYGVREIATGLGILMSRDPTPWICGRIAGDALDLATLAAGLSRDGPMSASLSALSPA